MNPPIVIIHGSALDKIPDSYTRYMEHCFRKAFKLEGTPLRVEYRSAENPFLERRKTATRPSDPGQRRGKNRK